MKRLLKSWVFWTFIVAPAAATAVSLLHVEQQGLVCLTCFSERRESRWRIGVKGKAAFPVWPAVAKVVESNVHLDGWTEAHEHVWDLVDFGPHNFFGYAGDPHLLGRYEGYPEFRAFLLAARTRGDLKRQDFLDALTFPSRVACRIESEQARLRRERMDPWVAEFLRKAAYRP